METDTLYLACTRSAQTYGGVPVLGFGANFIICYIGYFTFGGAQIWHIRGYGWILLFGVIHEAMRWLVEKDPNAFRIIQVAFDTFSVRSTLWSAPWFRSRKSIRMMASAL